MPLPSDIQRYNAVIPMTEVMNEPDRREVQRRIEVILARQLAGYLAVPIIIVDPWGSIIYYNEPAELLLGRRFDEDGPVPPEDWTRVFHLTHESGDPLAVEDVPLVSALRERRPTNLSFWMRGLDGTRHHVWTTGIPLLAEEGRLWGSMGIFWEMESTT